MPLDKVPEDGQVPVPNVLIVGAPKCGTTSLYAWLNEHPDVYMSPFKEPRFFCDDLAFHFRYDDLGDYLGLFAPAEQREVERIGESSVWYLYSKTAPGNIQDLCGPDIKLIIMLRNPVDMVYSWHSQLVWMGNEPIHDFQEAWDAIPDRRQGKRLPDRLNPLQGLFYDEIAAYHDQVERYFETFGREQVHVIIFDDLVADQEKTFQEVCRFLGIDETYRPDFERRNPNTKVRSHWFRDITRDLPSPVQAITEHLPMNLRLKLRELVKSANTKVEGREPLSDEMRQVLAATYRDDVKRLSDLLDRDLTHWTDLPDAETPPEAT